MNEISLHILDIAENAARSGAVTTAIRLDERPGELTVTIADDGCGMDAATLARACDPFFSTRRGAERTVGMGLPLFRLCAEMTGGGMTVRSRAGGGTTVTAVFHTDHIDCPPLGSIGDTLLALAAMHPQMRYILCHRRQNAAPVAIDTRQPVPAECPADGCTRRELLRAALAAHGGSGYGTSQGKEEKI